MANLVYSPKDILQKEFKTKMRGYDPVEVDEFLDNVIKDYEAYNKEILTLQEENNRLLAKLDQASKVQQAMPSRSTPEMPKSAAVTNFDILKRLSNLEREVFGKKLDDTPASNPISGMGQTPSYESNFHNSYERDVDHSETRQF
ncbi:cell division regulator GpsB [Enterococcus sp. DIV0242_7C1]|uniref:Cell cycle protein GpsB n=1 Tax=Candidatus Enterococcus dunnyi TaxID=1834192 RepID=A0A200JF17_9ENTE|nr:MULTISPECIES: cell division regulator GpsB [unclassified Enterococcus]MBO0468956.1 cell division regulator GpsB [Enterococcus sp. DIV0242_7C1]MCA5012539.1 cell division regulator GpsB [Enterococcus sp. S23]MCA5015790.1 cell division regulator GpsB [Enterococcus sp. S22(2020)]OUZ35754.1 cell division protein DivIVA [Enterococcus sp. 9D6_DIV0238]